MLPVCRPSAVYPVAVVAPPPQVGLADAPPPEVWTRIPQGTPGTLGGVGLRLLQALFAAASIAVMASTDIFPFCSAFSYLIAATSLQCLWSIALAFVYIYALLVKRSLLNLRAVRIFFVGDWITGTVTLSAACASAGITILIDNDVKYCEALPCLRLRTAVTMAFISWCALVPSFLFNFAYTTTTLARLGMWG
ncbi:CASP-like protein 16 [Triticum urartu]|uniref:CASP-like protein n=1 Tax=Triticum urartu TaxID=4572 RepID=A0A8R7USL7_TRIUA|nr:CASP-like protein 16 [Triticum dicoccoides]XP_048537329.1 CASP-like protein 16 [Triticum urartu]